MSAAQRLDAARERLVAQAPPGVPNRDALMALGECLEECQRVVAEMLEPEPTEAGSQLQSIFQLETED